MMRRQFEEIKKFVAKLAGRRIAHASFEEAFESLPDEMYKLYDPGFELTVKFSFPPCSRISIRRPSIAVCHVCEHNADGELNEECKRCEHGSEFSPIDIDPVAVSEQKDKLDARKDFLPYYMQPKKRGNKEEFIYVICCNDSIEGAIIGTMQQAQDHMIKLREKHRRNFAIEGEYPSIFYWHVHGTLLVR